MLFLTKTSDLVTLTIIVLLYPHIVSNTIVFWFWIAIGYHTYFIAIFVHHNMKMYSVITPWVIEHFSLHLFVYFLFSFLNWVITWFIFMNNIYFLLPILIWNLYGKTDIFKFHSAWTDEFTEQFSSNIYVVPNNLHFPSISQWKTSSTSKFSQKTLNRGRKS